MIRALLHAADDFFNTDGAWWILALDSILLIPVIFAVFFFPMAFLIGTGVALLLAVVVYAAYRVVHTHRGHT